MSPSNATGPIRMAHSARRLNPGIDSSTTYTVELGSPLADPPFCHGSKLKTPSPPCSLFSLQFIKRTSPGQSSGPQLVGSPAACNGQQRNGTMGGDFRVAVQQQLLQDEARCHAAKALLASLCTRPEDPCRFPSKTFAWSRPRDWIRFIHGRDDMGALSNIKPGPLAHNNCCFGLNLDCAGTTRDLQCFVCLFAGGSNTWGSHEG